MVIKSGGTIEEIQTSLGNDIAGIFYTKYAKSGYYYTLDDNSTVIQGDLTGQIVDFEGRESMFLLSPQMLMALDLGLNGGYKLPEQFVKPVYNSCMVNGEKQSTTGYCTLLALADDKSLLVQGAAYEEKYYSATDTKPEGVNSSYVGNLYVKTGAQTASVTDWGLAPVFHYKTFTEDSKVTNYAITEVQIYNRDTKKVETKLYSELTAAQKADYPVPVKEFGYGNAEDVSKQLPAPSTKYAIDNVVSFLGTIKEDVVQSWVPQGKFKQVSYIDKEILSAATEEDFANVGVLKRVCKGTTCYSATSVEEVVSKTGHVSYLVTDGYGTSSVVGVTSIDIITKVKLAYTKEGVLQLNTVKYVNKEPNTTGIVGTQYLEDYVDYYQAFIPITGTGSKTFACYYVGGVFANTNWDATNTNDSFSIEDVKSVIGSLQSATPASYEFSPSKCDNGQIALNISDEVMTKFYLDEMPNLQYLMIAKMLNYQMSAAEDGQLTLESTLSTIDGVAKPEVTVYRKQLDTLAYKYDDVVSKYSKAYGIDGNLIYAILMASSGVEGSTSSGCSLSTGSGCGVMSVKAVIMNAPSIKVTNFSTGGTDELVFDEAKLISDYDYNIRMGTAMLQNLMSVYEKNILLALQAYTSTTKYTDQLIAQANSVQGNVMDVRWTAFRSALGNGDAAFLEKVLGNTLSDVLQFNINNESVTTDISFLRTIKGTTSTALIKNLNQYLAQKYFTNDALNLEEIWGLMYLGQKSFDSTKYADVNAGFRIDTKGVSDEDKESIIQSLFAFSEGKPIQNYENMNTEYWRTKVRSLFMNTATTSLDVLYPAQDYIGGEITGLVKSNSYLVAVRDFGTVTTDVGALTYDDVEYRTIPNGQVLSMTDGKILEIIQGRNGKNASITIAATPITKEENSKTVVVYQAKFYYTDMKEIPTDLKVGDTIESGTIVGIVSSDNENKFNLAYYVNGEAIDANLIVEYVQYLVDANTADTGISISRINTAWLAGLASMEFSATDFAGSSNWFNPTGTGVKTAGTWSYSFGAHDAVDIGAPVGTPIQALGDGVIIDYMDDSPDYNGTTVPRTINSPTPVNRVLYVMEKDGYIYSVQLIHVQQGSVRSGSYTFEEGDVLANVGDNGHSTGPHLHMSVINHGNQTTLQAIINQYLDKPGYSTFGLNPKANVYERCENTSSFACGVPVDKYIFR